MKVDADLVGFGVLKKELVWTMVWLVGCLLGREGLVYMHVSLIGWLLYLLRGNEYSNYCINLTAAKIPNHPTIPNP